MRFFAWLRDWKRLKNKNIILADENYRLHNHNELLLEQNRAYSIANSDVGSKLLGLRTEKRNLIELLYRNRKPGTLKSRIDLDIQEMLTFNPHS